jgi:hypothetical protein
MIAAWVMWAQFSLWEPTSAIEEHASLFTCRQRADSLNRTARQIADTTNTAVITPIGTCSSNRTVAGRRATSRSNGDNHGTHHALPVRRRLAPRGLDPAARAPARREQPQVLGFYDPCCAHVMIAQHFMETGGWDEVVQRMPAFAAHLDAVIATAKAARGRTCSEVGPPFHYPTRGA